MFSQHVLKELTQLLLLILYINKVFLYQQNTLTRISYLQMGEKNCTAICEKVNKDERNIQSRIKRLFGHSGF